ncbi:MAG: hypothetical protein GF393_04715, partial [Armatimonadia bacterium]|nr:hypothetical protein [Armatimonadia bacterium]
MVASLVFIGGAVLAIRALDITWGDVRWSPLIVALLVPTPLAALLLALEFRVSVRITGHSVGVLEAFRVTLIASAANLLPLPGSAIVRIRAIRRIGPTYRDAAGATVLIGIAWVGLAAVLSSMALLATGRQSAGWPF